MEVNFYNCILHIVQVMQQTLWYDDIILKTDCFSAGINSWQSKASAFLRASQILSTV